MKISQANKGKKSWNEGGHHKAETREKIRLAVQANYLRKRTEEAALLGMTLEEFDRHKEEEKQRLKEERKASRKGLTEEGRKKMAEAAKRRWKNPEFREKMSLATRGVRKHSQETKAKIAEKVKLRWQDEDYRAKLKKALTNEQKEKISASLRKYWQTNPEKHAAQSAIMKEMWHDGDFRENRGLRRDPNSPVTSSEKSKPKKKVQKVTVKKADNSEETMKVRAPRKKVAKASVPKKEKTQSKIVVTGGNGTGKPREIVIYDDDDDDYGSEDQEDDVVFSRRRREADDNLVAVYDDNGKFVGRFTESEYDRFLAQKDMKR